MEIRIELDDVPDDVDNVVFHVSFERNPDLPGAPEQVSSGFQPAVRRGREETRVQVEQTGPDLDALRAARDQVRAEHAEQRDQPRGAHELHELDPNLRAMNTGPEPGQPPRIADPMPGDPDEESDEAFAERVEREGRISVGPAHDPRTDAAHSADVWTEPAPQDRSGAEREWDASRGEDGPR